MCNGVLSQIQVAGAGAGKTYSLAEKILDRYETKNNFKNIYALTYTNYAKKNIISRIMEINNGYIPNDISIETVHSFLLNEIIYPFNKLYFGTTYYRATSIQLSDKISLQKYQLNRLNQKGIIHNIQVFNKAKQMIVCRKGETKKLCEKKKLIVDYLVSSIDALFIDEAQDLDNDALSLFGELGKNIYLYMVGDSKQAIKYPNAFNEFVNKVPSNNYEILPVNTITRRIPERHLRVSNLFCSIGEQQTTISRVLGKIFYVYFTDKMFEKVYKLYLKQEALIYIRQENDNFSTKNGRIKFELEESIRQKILEKTSPAYDSDAYIKSLESCFINITKNKGAKAAINSFTKRFDITLDNNEYARLINDLNIDEKKKKLKCMSIDKVKGLERDLCMFIVDNTMLEYLFGIKKEINKESKRLYVALTRSKRDLILVIDESLMTDKKKEYIDIKFKEMNIPYLNSEYIESIASDDKGKL
ncbi:MAG: AAA family ATPase [Lachnospiraceae bacterium]|nr:AAA family ATPase [Lachnospiraceae bacterium]